ncbi:sigma-70 family RNA polymerase sigma factor [Megasphaera massiliensis]
MELEDKNYIPAKKKYVAVIVSEVEFLVNAISIRKLSKMYMPAWNMQAYMNYFSGSPSGVLLFLRVYEVNEELNLKYVKKGGKGSYQIIKLYDEWENEISLQISGLKPVISDNKFEYIKDEIIHVLKVDGAFIAEYDTSKSGMIQLKERYDASDRYSGVVQSWDERRQKWAKGDFEDFDDDFDMAQLDYDRIYDKVVSEYPGMKYTIDCIRKLRPTRLGEYNYHLNNVHKHDKEGKKSEQRLFEATVRFAVRNALKVYEEDGMDLEDAFQEACIGIIYAIRHHNDEVEGLFTSYVGLWIFQVMNRDLPYFQYNFRLPAHYMETVKKCWVEIIDNYGNIDLNDISIWRLRKILSKYTSCEGSELYRLSQIMVLPKNFDDIYHRYENRFSSIETVEDEALRRMCSEHLMEILDILKDKERKVIILRLGLNGNREHTLEEIGQVFNVTRERIRQIEAKALEKLRSYMRNHP